MAKNDPLRFTDEDLVRMNTPPAPPPPSPPKTTTSEIPGGEWVPERVANPVGVAGMPGKAIANADDSTNNRSLPMGFRVLPNNLIVSGGQSVLTGKRLPGPPVAAGSQPAKREDITSTPTASSAAPTPVGVDSALPRYKRVDNPDERAGGGFPGTSRIATRDGRLVDLSREGSALPSKAQGPENRFTGTPGFKNQDLVDLYGSGAVSTMSDEDWAAQVAKNSAVPSGWVRDPNARPGAPASEQFIRTGGDSAMPKLDYSNPTALLASAIPWAIKVGQNKAKRREDEQQRQLFKDKYGIDLQRMELGLKAPVYAGQAAHSQAEAKKAEAEAAAFRPKTRDGAILQKLIETTYGNMTLLPPEEQAAEMGKINKWWAQIDAIEGGGGAAPQAKKPSREEFVAAAKQANPGYSDQEIIAEFDKRYGGRP